MSKVNNEVLNESVMALDSAITRCSSNLSNLDSSIDNIDKEYDSIKALDGILLDPEHYSSLGTTTWYWREKPQISGGEKIKDSIAKFKNHYAGFKEELERLSKDLEAAKEAAISIMAEKEVLTSKLTESSSDKSRNDLESLYESIENKTDSIATSNKIVNNASSDSLNREKSTNFIEQFRKDNNSQDTSIKSNSIKTSSKASRGISYSGLDNSSNYSPNREYKENFLDKISDSVEDITRGVSKKVPLSNLTANNTKGITKNSIIPIAAGLGAAGASGFGYSTIHKMKNNYIYDDDNDIDDDIEEDDDLLLYQPTEEISEKQRTITKKDIDSLLS